MTKQRFLKLCTLLLVLFQLQKSSAQSVTVSGTVVDSGTGQAVQGVNVYPPSGKNGMVTGATGEFSITVAAGSRSLLFTHVAFEPYVAALNAGRRTTIDLGTVRLEPRTVSLDEVKIISNFATDRNTPSAVSTIDSKQLEQKPGNTDFLEMLKLTPGLYSTREGGGSGDSRVTIRGFQQENLAVLLNGVPVSSMENGLVYWSNWGGLADAAEAVQVQRGLGASRVAMNSVGGTINIITRSVPAAKGGTLKSSLTSYGNRKTVFGFSTGKMRHGSALTFLGSRTSGPGLVDAAYVDSWSYFLSLSREISSRQRIVVTAMGSPDRHGQRNYPMTKSDFEKYGVKYNSNWGMYNGRMLLLSENFYHKPQLTINHYLNISPAAFLATSAYVSYGYGGGRYTEAFDYGASTWSFTKSRQLDFDRIYLNNSTHNDTAYTADGQMIAHFSKNILTNYLASHYWAGMLSSLTLKAGEKLKFTAGIHGRSFRSHLYEKIDNLLGGDCWIEKYAWSLAGVAGRSQVKKVGDIINVDNYSMMLYGNVFGQAEYSSGRLNAFAAASVSGTRYRRNDPYNYVQNSLSEAVAKAGFDIKAGAGFRAGHGNIYANAGFYSREPYYKFVFVNFSNAVARELRNEKIAAVEAGYAYSDARIEGRLNLYYTHWKDRSMLSRENIQLANSTSTRSLVRGLNAGHSGIEAEIAVKPARGLKLTGNASLGRWKWLNDVSASIYDDRQVLVDNMYVYTKGLFVGDAPQTQLGISAEYRPESGFRIAADWVYFDRLYANFDPVNRADVSDRMQPFRIPAYGIADLSIGYDLSLRNVPVSLDAACQNLFGRKVIARGDDGPDHSVDTFRGYWTLGRTLTLACKISF